MQQTDTQYDFDRLSPEIQKQLADMLQRDNRAAADRGREKILPPKGVYVCGIKRLLDIVIAAAALLITLPINAVLAVITYFDVGRPILFRQERLGKDGAAFYLCKFRNMTNETDENGNLLPADKRITRWGSVARALSLDELLNFWSILKGDMSLIGPRPLPVVYRGRFSDYHNARHLVRPGLDCPLHRPDMGYMTWENRLENDVWYVQNISFRTDVRLFLLLIREVICGKEKADRGAGGREGTFMGYFPDGKVMNSFQIPREYYERTIKETDTEQKYCS